MENYLEAELLDYYKKYKLLEEKGGPEKDGDLFEELLEKEVAILNTFGLPEALTHCKILHKLVNRKTVTVAAIQKTIVNLQKAAEKHLSSPVLTDLELLQKAKEENLSPYDVLPEMGLPTHVYPIFLLEVGLHFVEPQAILDEFYALKRLDCYSEIYHLKEKHPRSFRRTKIYKQLKPYLKYLDQFVKYNSDLPVLFEDWIEEEKLDIAEIITFKEEISNPYNSGQVSLFDEPVLLNPPKEFKPDYITLTHLIVLEEIMFSRDSGVTVTGKLLQSYRPVSIMLGFEFEQLTEVLLSYFKPNFGALNYFNKNRQQMAGDEPVIVNLQEKLGKELLLDQHYFRVYKPESLDRNGHIVPMREEFYIVEEVIDKARYDQQHVKEIKADLQGWFYKMMNHYYIYLNHKSDGLSEQEAKKAIGLEDELRFKICKLLYKLDKHGGKLQ